MMRVYTLHDGKWSVERGLDVGAAREIERSTDLAWVRLDRASAEDMAELEKMFELHPLSMHELKEDDARPSLEDFDAVTFCNLPVPDYKAGDKTLDWEEVGVWLADDFVLTVSPETIQPLDELETRLTEHKLTVAESTLSHLFYWIVDTIVDAWFPFIEAMEQELDELETGVLQGADPEELDRIRDIKRLVISTRRVTLPMRDVIVSLERDDHPNIDDQTTLYLRHTSDRMKRVVERLDQVKEMALISQDTWNAALANEQNAVMKRLTVLAGLVLIPSLFAGIGGMNFNDFPADISFWWFLAIMIIMIVAGLVYSRRKGML